MISTRQINLIIPYHNPSIEEVDRLFKSLTRQCVSYDTFKVIVVDDNSDNVDEYRYFIKDNYPQINKQFEQTATAIHCPGNTRREGMAHLDEDVQYVCFCDQDDYFEDGAFASVLDYIRNANHSPIYVVSTIMGSYSQEKQQYTEKFVHKQPWLHGKFYNVPDLIRKYNLNFKKDLVTHEDIYFNSLVLSTLFKLRTDWDYLDVVTYRWVENPNSLTRRTYTDRGYFYENFGDYVTAAAEPFWEGARDKNDWMFVNQIMMTILHCYFYYEAASYYNGPTMFKDVLNCIILLLKKAQEDLDYDLDYIVDFIYQDPEKFDLVKKDCEICTGKMICKTSLRDFIYKVGKMEVYNEC